MAVGRQRSARELRGLFAAGPIGGLTDAELWGRYAGRRDPLAFAALVARHGPMVLAVCRDVLRCPHDAEDAFQATFLVLALKARTVRDGEALAGWLHRVARRVAVRANREAARRRAKEGPGAAADGAADPGPDRRRDDLVASLHDEIARLPETYRAPVVLCDLGGLTRDEAAGRLGWPPGTVAGRLARARALLRDRLTRRGAAPATVAGLAPRPPADVPPSWAEATSRVDASSLTPRAAALGQAVAASLRLEPLRPIALALVALGALAPFRASAPGNDGRAAPPAAAHADVLPTSSPAPPPLARPAEGAGTYRGVVLDPEGRPVRGARVYLGHRSRDSMTSRLKGETGPDGRFRFEATDDDLVPPGAHAELTVSAAADRYGPDWVEADGAKQGDLTLRLAPADVTINGRLLDANARPVAEVSVEAQVAHVGQGARGGSVPFDKPPAGGAIRTRIPVGDLIPAVRTDGRGSFQIPGVGDDRLVELQIRGPGVATETVRVATTPGLNVLRANEVVPPAHRFIKTYGPSFVHAVEAGKIVEGVVRDKQTGEPVPDVMVNVRRYDGLVDNLFTEKVTRSGPDGSFRVEGYSSRLADFSFFVQTSERLPYFRSYLRVPSRAGPNSRPEDPVRADVGLERGVAVSGRVTDAATGRPVTGNVWYQPFADNPRLKSFGGFLPSRGFIGADGRFLLAALPGRGVVTVQLTRDADAYRRARPGPDVAGPDDHLPDQPGRLKTHPQPLDLATTFAYRVIDPAAGAEKLDCDLTVDPVAKPPEPPAPAVRGPHVAEDEKQGQGADRPDRAIAGVVLDVEGKPIAGAQVFLCRTGRDRVIPRPVATTGPDGRFRFEAADEVGPTLGPRSEVGVAAAADGYGPDWVAAPAADGPDAPRRVGLVLRLEHDEVKVKGRFLDSKSKPVAGAVVTPRWLFLRKNGRGETVPYFADEADRAGTTTVRIPAAGLIPEARTDDSGTFQLDGVGDSRVVDLMVTRAGITTDLVRASTKAGKSAHIYLGEPDPHLERPERVYASVFAHAVELSEAIEGVVRDKESGEPIEGVEVSADVPSNSFVGRLATRSDARGRYRLEGLPSRVFVSVGVRPTKTQPYFPANLRLPSRPEGAPTVAFDVELVRGQPVSGRVTEAATGRPVRGLVYYRPLAGNPVAAKSRSANFEAFSNLDRDGRYSLPALAGPGVVWVRANDEAGAPYRPAPEPGPADVDRGATAPADPHMLATAGRPLDPDDVNAFRVIDPKGPADFDLTVDPGRSVKGTVVDPGGKPLDRVAVFGLGPLRLDIPRVTGRDGFTVHALAPGEPRRVFLFHEARRLGGHVDLNGDEAGPVVARMERCATVVVRFVDGAGRPVSGLQLYRTYDGPDGQPRVAFPPGRRVATPAEQHRARGGQPGPGFLGDNFGDQLAGRPSGSDGRVRIDDVVPGVRVLIRSVANGGEPVVDRALEPGEVVDLGDVSNGIGAPATPPAR